MTKTTSAEGYTSRLTNNAYRIKMTDGANVFGEQTSKVKQMYRKGKTVNALG